MSEKPTKLELKKKKGKKKKKAKKSSRAASSIFAMFTPQQNTEFKEIFNMIDENRTGAIDKEELENVYASLGIQVSDDFLDKMMAEGKGSITFTTFLSMFGEKLQGTDPEDFVCNAFACFDDLGDGKIPEEDLKDALMNMGDDRFTEEEVEEMFDDAPFDDHDNFLYKEYAHMLKWGPKNLEDDDKP